MKKPVATRDEIRAFDRYAIEELGVPGIVLMENAGRQIAAAALDILGSAENPHVLILAGRGNNGGDGFVVARHLALYGIEAKVLVIAPRDAISGDADVNLKILEAIGFDIHTLSKDAETAARELKILLAEADLVVDGLLGTGTRGEIQAPYRSVITAVNAAGKPVLAIDIPSGLDPDTGRPLGLAIRATKTVTLAAIKKGFENPEAAAYTGEVILADIGVPFERLATSDG